ncbi:MAG: DNA-deoxyinosine glycosylase [Puniceicoccales bacterium]|jgi:hypoxanthine-DNA glycosylase|nr:DNA-deoxyinosine glycosylase [Puniceicoccales bacterium]
MAHFKHPFEPIFSKESTILILGSFPSVASRERNFYYAHPQNRFWKIIAHLTQTDPIPTHIDEKKFMLLSHKIALWDVIQSCNIEGSSDSRIRHVIPVDLSSILKNVPISNIFTNGRRAYQLYRKYFSKYFPINVTILPSTSPANAIYNFKKLMDRWSVIFDKTERDLP